LTFHFLRKLWLFTF